MAKINGKSKEEVMRELRADFKETEFKDRDGYPFLPYEVFVNRVETVLGYNAQCDVINTKYEKVENSPVLLADARFVIFDDEGRILLSKSYPCGVNVIVSNESGACSNFSNATETLYQKAFSKGCKLYGVGVKQLKDKREALKDQKKTSSYSTEQERYTLKITQEFSANGKGYKGVAEVEELGESREICIWSQGITSIKEMMDMETFCLKMKPGVKFHIYGKEGEYRGKKQLVLNKIEPKS